MDQWLSLLGTRRTVGAEGVPTGSLVVSSVLSEAMAKTNVNLLPMTASHSSLVSQVMDKRSFFPPLTASHPRQ